MLACLVVGLVGWLAPQRAQAGDCVHTVAKGDTLSRIAIRSGVSEADLIATNSALKKNPNMLRLGQEIDVCAAKKAAKSASKKAAAKAPRCGKRGRLLDHEVRSGETLSKIASHYGVTDKDITRHNAKLAKRPDLLRSGETIKVCVDRSRARNHKACNYETPLYQHEVVPGEHLGQIAGRYGVRRGSIVKLNASLKKNPNMLRVGQKLRVCPNIAPRERTKITYAVQSGDTFGEIAKKYGLTRNELLRYQRGKLEDPNSLRTGQRLVVWADGGTVAGFGGVDRDTGVLKAGMQLPPGRYYVVKWDAGAWGTSKTIRTIQSAVASYQRRKPGGPKIHIGDISKRGGGKFPPHLSHQHGRDVDIGYVLKGKYAHETRFKSANGDNLDVARTWALIKSFIDTRQIRYIFMDYRVQKQLYEYAKKRGVSEDTLDELFQYPRGRGRTHGMIRHWKGHRNHFHVRFER